ncbi:MAG: right-handed parallel beta-helix repeat-containing protein [bacterium]
MDRRATLCLLPLVIAVFLAGLVCGCGVDAPEEDIIEEHEPGTVRVPGDRATVTGALLAAHPGDTVLVASGTYEESGLFMMPGVLLRSKTLVAADVVIDGRGQGIVLICSNLDDAVRIEGITFTGGAGDQAGGVFIDSTRVTMTGCVIEGNVGVSAAGGLRCSGESELTLIDCIIRNNQVDAYRGGGLWCGEFARVVLENCWFTKNSALIGGGLWCGGGAEITMTSCRLDSNQAVMHGGGICLEGYGIFTGVESSFQHNSAPEAADGMFDPDLAGEGFPATLRCCQIDLDHWLGWRRLVIDDDDCR